jgi:hypothetical protein
MIMSFCRYYSFGPEIAHSKLAEIRRLSIAVLMLTGHVQPR